VGGRQPLVTNARTPFKPAYAAGLSDLMFRTSFFGAEKSELLLPLSRIYSPELVNLLCRPTYASVFARIGFAVWF